MAQEAMGGRCVTSAFPIELANQFTGTRIFVTIMVLVHPRWFQYKKKFSEVETLAP